LESPSEVIEKIVMVQGSRKAGIDVMPQGFLQLRMESAPGNPYDAEILVRGSQSFKGLVVCGNKIKINDKSARGRLTKAASKIRQRGDHYSAILIFFQHCADLLGALFIRIQDDDGFSHTIVSPFRSEKQIFRVPDIAMTMPSKWRIRDFSREDFRVRGDHRSISV
jgi:hypothetical protein